MPGADLREGRLSAAEVREWEALLGEAWGILRRRHWTAAEEIRVLLRVVTPLNAPDGRATSGTPRHAPGLIGLSPPADAYALAETLVHEAQHTKLNAILDHLPLTAPDDGTRYQAPWRDDPRPLLALLHGTYAHLAVAGFWRRETGTPHAAEHFARWRTATHASALTLVTSPSLTPHGHTFVTEMTATLTRWLADPLP
ncbi:HEXXH motif-containing putative peptide modification protein [Actinocorallia sp. API 0066]|nr:HEXXH motif-containing putative peptide modification protein [Actinocorallia sp. API 0066]